MQEELLYPWQQPRITREETTAGMGLIVNGILTNIEIRNAQLGLEDDASVREAVDRLTLRSLILVNGIKRNTKSGRLGKFLDRSAGLYELTSITLRDFTDDRGSLIDKVNRISVALQGDMSTNQLLTETAKRKLRELDELKTTHLGS